MTPGALEGKYLNMEGEFRVLIKQGNCLPATQLSSCYKAVLLNEALQYTFAQFACAGGVGAIQQFTDIPLT